MKNGIGSWVYILISVENEPGKKVLKKRVDGQVERSEVTTFNEHGKLSIKKGST